MTAIHQLITLKNDGQTIDVVAEAAFNENDAAVDTVVATFTASDEEDGTPKCGFTPGTHRWFTTRSAARCVTDASGC
ncbi:hypothetical protein ACFSF3_25970 [Vibrio chagasii]